jgi:hypothetical protein
VDLPTAPAQNLKLKNGPPDAFDATRRDRCGEDSHCADLYKIDDDVSCVDFFTLYERKADGFRSRKKRLLAVASAIAGVERTLAACQEIAARMLDARGFHQAVTLLSVGHEEVTEFSAVPAYNPRLAIRASTKLLPGSCQPHRGTESPEGATIGIAQSAHYHANDEGMRDGQRMEMQSDTINARHSPK